MKKLFVTITLLLVLVGSAFATNWKKYGTHKDGERIVWDNKM